MKRMTQQVAVMVFCGAAVCAAAAGSGKNLILDGETIPLDPDVSVLIDPISGNVVATSLTGDFSPAPPLSAGPVHVEPATVTEGENIAVAWSSVSAADCEPVGSLPGWGDQVIGSAGLLVFPASGPPGSYDVGVECSDGSSAAVSDMVGVHVDEAVDPVPPSVQVSRSPAVVTAGESVTVTWTVSGASSCQASGTLSEFGWSGSKNPSGGSTQIDIPSGASGSRTIGMTCTNQYGSTQANQVTVSIDGGAVEGCENRQPPSNLSWATNVIHNSSSNGVNHRVWEEVWGAPFPRGNKRTIRINANQYAAIEFNSGSDPGTNGIRSGQFATENPHSSTLPSGHLLYSISRCPGDFHPPEGNAACKRAGITGWNNLRWTFGNNAGKCELEPNTTYFLNIVYTPAGVVTPDANGELAWFCNAPGQPRCGNDFDYSPSTSY